MFRSSFLFVANWKMQRPYNEAQEWITQNEAELGLITVPDCVKIILCPSFTELPLMQKAFEGTPVEWGAQDCSEHELGAYTGQVAAESLKNLGCRFSIVGHSERRQYAHETNEQVAKKALRLIHNNITPIVCVGENAQEKQNGETEKVVTQQLTSLFKALPTTANEICIAYEPIWAIGTGNTPTPQEIEAVFSLITQEAHNVKVRLLYGGSVKASNASSLKNIKRLEGFLIGGASLDFQELQKIVSSLCNPT